MEQVIETHRPEETFAWGERLGALLLSGDVIGLSGSLGAGKTLFARGVAQGAGVPLDDVSSPTYAIIQSYQGRLTLHHADLYRIRSAADLYGTGYFELLESDGAALVEWIERVPSASPRDMVQVVMDITAPNSRRLRISARGARPVALVTAWVG